MTAFCCRISEPSKLCFAYKSGKGSLSFMRTQREYLGDNCYSRLANVADSLNACLRCPQRVRSKNHELIEISDLVWSEERRLARPVQNRAILRNCDEREHENVIVYRCSRNVSFSSGDVGHSTSRAPLNFNIQSKAVPILELSEIPRLRSTCLLLLTTLRCLCDRLREVSQLHRVSVLVFN
jgi:hypothetical protein